MHSGPYKNIDGYNFISNCRQKCICGGVAFYIKDTLEFTLCDELTIMKEKNFESIFINIQNKNDIIKCGTIYQSPLNDSESNIKFKSHLDECLKNIKSCQKCFIFGDFNYDLAKTVKNSHVSDFTEIMLNHCFYSLINKPTRISQVSATVLDHIWTNSYSP